MNRICPGCRAEGSQIQRYGRYFRRSDSRHIQRFRCTACKLHFSSATGTACYRQKKRRLNHQLAKLLPSGLSQRRLALLLRCSRTTVARKLIFLAEQARHSHERFIKQWISRHGQFLKIHFDDLETIEHTKLKPVTVCVVIDAETRIIIDLGVAPMAAKGPLAALSRQKYGVRADRSRSMRQALFKALRSVINERGVFITDQHQHYPVVLKKHFPKSVHYQHKSERSSLGGQGELKKVVVDPLFNINHTLAMLRANINRLIRRTWCTTKRVDRLEAHLRVYADYHNRELLTRGNTVGKPLKK